MKKTNRILLITGKILLWCVLFISLTGTVFLAAAVGWMQSEGYYDSSLETIKNNNRQKNMETYAALAVKNYIESGKGSEDKTDLGQSTEPNAASAAYFKEKSFCYGILSSEVYLDSSEQLAKQNIDLNQEKSYLERNFSKKVQTQDLAVESFSQNSNIYYHDGGLASEYYIHSTGSDNESYYVSAICYDKKTGVFYYKTEDKNYLASNVEISMQISLEEQEDVYLELEFLYSKDTQKYQLTQAWIDGEVFDPGTARQILSDWQEEPDDILFQEEGLTFNMLEGTEIAPDTWQSICFDNVRMTTWEDIDIVETDKRRKSIQKDMDCYLDEYYALHVEKPKSYYVIVSYLDETVLAREEQAYLAGLQGKNVLTKLYTIYTDKSTELNVLTDVLSRELILVKDRFLVLLLCCILMGIGSFIGLILLAGHRESMKELTLSRINKAPLGMVLILYFIEIGVVLVITDAVINSYRYAYYILIPFWILLFIGSGCVILDFAVRVKAGKWWKNTFCYRIGVWLHSVAGKGLGAFKNMLSNCKMRKKAVGIYLIWTLAEFFFLYICVSANEPGLLIWGIVICKVVVVFILGKLIIQLECLKEGGILLAKGETGKRIDTSGLWGELKQHGENLNSIQEGIREQVNERMKSEHFKTELITNVSHDIKTPLTSIINYVDLLEKTNIEDETQKEYLEVLSRQSVRLKKLIEDLIEASKASTGNLEVNFEILDAGVFLTQIVGEYEEKLASRGLQLYIRKPETEVKINADSRHLWRVIDNLMNNIYKYAQTDSRVYVNLESDQDNVRMIFRNMSGYPLTLNGQDLTERFVREDQSRNTEGNGLGLSIASNLMQQMQGTLEIVTDGDLFKAILTFASLE